MIFIIFIVIATMLLFCKNDNTPSFFGMVLRNIKNTYSKS